ncbi:Protein kinase domain [Macleaya cordata]|uniref:Protein kinase domain n=1 Tax=Macleaya cordata TaxID=56857 RepID=A0A200R1G0_MACCD|nr:Protein kinase domain [Macleaya cordata]
MAESVDVILDFLRRNRFTRAEAALLGELTNRPDLKGSLQKPNSEENNSANLLEEEKEEKRVVKRTGSRNSSEVSKELIIKEIECGAGRNGSESKWKTTSVGERNKPNESSGAIEKSLNFVQGSEGTSEDLYSWKFSPTNGPIDLLQKDSGNTVNKFSELQISEQSKYLSVIDTQSGDQRVLWPGSTSKADLELKYEKCQMTQISDRKKLDQGSKTESLAENPWSKSEEPTTKASMDQWKECSVKTVFPFPKGDSLPSYDSVLSSGDSRKEGKRKLETNDIRVAMKEEVDEVGRSLFFGKSQGSSEDKNIGSLDLTLMTENHKEELPRLPPVKLKSEDKSVNIHWEEKFDRQPKFTSADNTFLIGSFLDVPVGQEINSSGGKRTVGSSWLSVSQGIAEDTSDLVSGFATVGDGLSDMIDYPNEYWDSDEYDDDDDVGYMRQPIEDETWFLAHEIDYPSDNEKGIGHGSIPDQQEIGPSKEEDDDQSFAEEDSYFSGEQYFQAKNIEPVEASDDPIGHSMAKMYRRKNENDLIAHYDGQLMDEEELNLMRAEPVWQGFVTQTNELVMLGNGRVRSECERPRPDDLCIDDDQHGSVRSIGVGISSDIADIGSEVRESLVGESSEGDLEYFHDHDVGISGSRHFQPDTDKKYLDRSNRDKGRAAKHDSDKYIMGHEKGTRTFGTNHTDAGFSFPPPLRSGDSSQEETGKSPWPSKCNDVTGDETNDYGNGLIATDDMLATWRRKSSDSSPVKSSRDENNANAVRSGNSTESTVSNDECVEREHMIKGEDDKASDAREEDPGTTMEDEEAAAVQEQVRQIKAQEEEFETFNLKIVHRKNRTGFEEDKNFHVVLNSVIAGRYHVTEYLGSAAFSKAIQAHDLHTGMDVCVKIIKNNKDFFDQSLDEIKLLKFVNKNDPADKYHILRLYDYFYYREHLLIVCELLKANLYEFHKFNRESGGEVYFTMPRLQSITIQCLEALQFLHGLGLIHCDLKPENILVKSYSRCEVKVIDLGSSCFQTDHLCSYVQSRSYRAPEVILGLPYDKKIDIWSLGCILAELCTGNVLFQNDSPATLLARVIGIIGPIEQGMLAKGRDTYKYFTKNHMLYERSQETSRLEYLIPKKSSLRHRLPMGDQGFVDFVAHLLEVNPKKRPTASEALKHPWLSYPYEPISS